MENGNSNNQDKKKEDSWDWASSLPNNPELRETTAHEPRESVEEGAASLSEIESEEVESDSEFFEAASLGPSYSGKESDTEFFEAASKGSRADSERESEFFDAGSRGKSSGSKSGRESIYFEAIDVEEDKDPSQKLLDPMESLAAVATRRALSQATLSSGRGSVLLKAGSFDIAEEVQQSVSEQGSTPQEAGEASIEKKSNQKAAAGKKNPPIPKVVIQQESNALPKDSPKAEKNPYKQDSPDGNETKASDGGDMKRAVLPVPLLVPTESSGMLSESQKTENTPDKAINPGGEETTTSNDNDAAMDGNKKSAPAVIPAPIPLVIPQKPSGASDENRKTEESPKREPIPDGNDMKTSDENDVKASPEKKAAPAVIPVPLLAPIPISIAVPQEPSAIPHESQKIGKSTDKEVNPDGNETKASDKKDVNAASHLKAAPALLSVPLVSHQPSSAIPPPSSEEEKTPESHSPGGEETKTSEDNDSNRSTPKTKNRSKLPVAKAEGSDVYESNSLEFGKSQIPARIEEGAGETKPDLYDEEANAISKKAKSAEVAARKERIAQKQKSDHRTTCLAISVMLGSLVVIVSGLGWLRKVNYDNLDPADETP